MLWIFMGEICMCTWVILNNNHTSFKSIASSGEYSDWQEACNLMEKIEQKSRNEDDGIQYNAKDYANYLGKILFMGMGREYILGCMWIKKK